MEAEDILPLERSIVVEPQRKSEHQHESFERRQGAERLQHDKHREHEQQGLHEPQMLEREHVNGPHLKQRWRLVVHRDVQAIQQRRGDDEGQAEAAELLS